MVPLPVVLLIFISSNYPQGNLNEGIANSPTSEPVKGFVDSGKSPKAYGAIVNDLTASDFKFPDDPRKGTAVGDSTKNVSRGKIPENNKNEKNKNPVPLYSLVKNDCGEGYALDENGVCQKTITVRNGKKFDSEKRRKRHVLQYKWMIHGKNKVNEIPNSKIKASGDCGALYPGLTSDGNGGCRKAKDLEEPFNKSLPP